MYSAVLAGAAQEILGDHRELQMGPALHEQDAIIRSGTPSNCRISDCDSARIASNALLRWLISMIEAPTPGKASKSRWAFSSTGKGNTAGPGEKLKTRSVMGKPFRQWDEANNRVVKKGNSAMGIWANHGRESGVQNPGTLRAE